MELEDNDEDIIICSECKSENATTNKFCLECGRPILIEETVIETVICTNCNREVEVGIKFCTECGAKIKDNNIASCPVCFVKLEPGLKYCTACGAEVVSEEKTITNTDEEVREGPKSEGEPIVDSMVNTGKDIMKGLDGILNKAASSLDTSGESRKSREQSGKARIKPKFKKDVHPGYLVCDKCGGYYELEAGESLDDFEECQCGGKLEHKETV